MNKVISCVLLIFCSRNRFWRLNSTFWQYELCSYTVESKRCNFPSSFEFRIYRHIPCTYNSIFIVFLTVRNLDGILEPKYTHTHNEYYMQRTYFDSKGHKMWRVDLYWIWHYLYRVRFSTNRKGKQRERREKKIILCCYVEWEHNHKHRMNNHSNYE